MNTQLQKNLFSTTKQALLLGGAILKKGFTQKRQVKFKTPTSPVTQVDLASEKAIIGLIRKKYPDHAFLAEESNHVSQESIRPAKKGQPRWIIDPLDGTVNFLHTFPISCVSIGVEVDGVVQAGGIYDPFRDELFLARRGGGATMNGKRIRVSQQPRLERSLLVTGFPYDHREHSMEYLKIVDAFLRRCMDIRRLGSAAIDLAWVACGRSDGFWEQKLNPWDVAAGLLLVEEAGGKVSDFNGKKIDINDTAQTLASNGFIHSQMIRVFTAGRHATQRGSPKNTHPEIKNRLKPAPNSQIFRTFRET